jgi:hypothetical protein
MRPVTDGLAATALLGDGGRAIQGNRSAMSPLNAWINCRR